LSEACLDGLNHRIGIPIERLVVINCLCTREATNDPVGGGLACRALLVVVGWGGWAWYQGRRPVGGCQLVCWLAGENVLISSDEFGLQLGDAESCVEGVSGILDYGGLGGGPCVEAFACER